MSISASIGAALGRLVGEFSRSRRETLSASTTGSGGGYAGGRSDRRNDPWVPSNAGPNTAADLTLSQLRDRCRDLGRNHPQLAGAVNSIVTSVVGQSGIRVRPQTEWPELNERIRDYMRDNWTHVDAGRTMTERAYQAELVSELVLAGEMLVHFGFAPSWRGHPAGPCMEAIVAERLDIGLNDITGENVVRQGVEFDPLGRVVKYHVYKHHPNDGRFMVALPYIGNRSIVSIAADECSMAVLRRQAGQIRGVPLAAPVIHELAFAKKLKDAALMSAMTQSCIGLIVKGSSPAALRDKIGEASAGLYDADGVPVRRLSPGQIMYLPHGIETDFNAPNLPGPSFESMVGVIDRENAAALGMDIAGYSKNFGDATFSAIRADQLQVNRFYRFMQQLVLEFEGVPWYEARLSHGISSGAIELDAEQAEAWADIEQRRRILRSGGHFPGFGWVDPKQEATAAETAIKAGIRSRPDVIAEMGDDPEETLREQIAFEALEKQLREDAGLSSAPAAAPAAGTEPPAADDQEADETKDEDRDGKRSHAMNRRVKAGAAHHSNGVAHHAPA